MIIPKTEITYQLRNYEKNREWLEQIPHVPYLDLAIIFCFQKPLEEEEEDHLCLVTNREAELWHMSPQELEVLAQENTKRILPPIFYTLEEMISRLSQGEFPLRQPPGGGLPMYVLTNEEKLYGASAILYPELLKTISGWLDKDLYILPSSIHECILVPASGNYTQKDLEAIVREINETQVPEEEFLSNYVYFYSKSGDFLSF